MARYSTSEYTLITWTVVVYTKYGDISNKYLKILFTTSNFAAINKNDMSYFHEFALHHNDTELQTNVHI